MANETSRGYLFVAINWDSRWVFIAMYRHKTAETARGFLGDLKRACPIRTHTILTGMARRSLTAFLVCAGALQHDSRRLKRFAQLSVLNTGWPHQDRRKPTAWLSGSTAASRASQFWIRRRAGDDVAPQCLALEPPACTIRLRQKNALASHETMAQTQTGIVKQTAMLPHLR